MENKIIAEQRSRSYRIAEEKEHLYMRNKGNSWVETELRKN